MEVTRDIMVNFRCGYLFRPITPDLGINDVPFTSSAAESRLKGYLKEMNADIITAKRFMISPPAVITLALTVASLAEVMHHVGRTRRHSLILHAVSESLKSGWMLC